MLFHIMLDKIEKYIKFSTDRDCLGSGHKYARLELETYRDLFDAVQELEWKGYNVCVDTLDVFYETEE